MTALRLAFMGTPDFAVPVLQALVAGGHEVACVYCQPPRPAGRGQKLRPSPVQQKAEELGIPVRYPETLKGKQEQQEFQQLDLDAAVVVAYGLILPQAILSAPKLGCINVHASLLPRWRGAAPIQRAILAGDRETGVTLMAMDAGLDTGDMLAVRKLPITDETTASSLHDELSALGAEMICPLLADLAEGRATAVPQPQEGVTYAAKLAKDEGRLDWMQPAQQLARQVRAFAPWPGAWFKLNGDHIKVLAAEPVECMCTPGFVRDNSLTIGCGRDALRITRLQRPGKKAMSAEDFQRGKPIECGIHLPY